MQKSGYYLIGALACMLFAACEKEYSFESGTPPVTGSGLLISSTQQQGTTKIELYLDYSPGAKLIQNSVILTGPGLIFESSNTVNRSTAGVIGSTQLKLAAISLGAADTIDYSAIRNASGRLTAILLKPKDIMNSAGYDSLVYSYNTAGKIIGVVNYLVPYDGSAVEPFQSFIYTYVGNNMVKSEEFSHNGSLSNSTPEETINFEYDTNPVSYLLSMDEFAFGLFTINVTAAAVNNVTRTISKIEDGSGDITTTNYTYTYGPSGKPISAVVNTLSTGLPAFTSNMTFVYQ